MDMGEYRMQASLHAFLIMGSAVKQVEDNRYEVLTPYQDTKGRITLYATTDGEKIRLSDGGYLYENFLSKNDANTPFQIEMGVDNGGDPEGGARLENHELVMDCTVDTFGQSVVTLAHGIIIIGTGKSAMLMMSQVFAAIMTRPPEFGDLGPMPEGPKYEA